MKVKELITTLQKLNPEVEVVLDVDDGVSGNFLEVTEVYPTQSQSGAIFVILKH